MKQTFNSVHHLQYDSSGCHQVSPTTWYSILTLVPFSMLYVSCLHIGNGEMNELQLF